MWALPIDLRLTEIDECCSEFISVRPYQPPYPFLHMCFSHDDDLTIGPSGVISAPLHESIGLTMDTDGAIFVSRGKI